MSACSIRIIVADEHRGVRRGICAFLDDEGDMSVVAEAESSAQTVALVKHYQPDVLLLDIHLSDGSGTALTRRLRAEKHTLGILLMTAFDDLPILCAALDAGANGCVLKTAEAEEIVRAVRTVAISSGRYHPLQRLWSSSQS